MCSRLRCAAAVGVSYLPGLEDGPVRGGSQSMDGRRRARAVRVLNNHTQLVNNHSLRRALLGRLGQSTAAKKIKKTARERGGSSAKQWGQGRAEQARVRSRGRESERRASASRIDDSSGDGHSGSGKGTVAPFGISC